MNTKLTIGISIITQLLFAGVKTAAHSRPVTFTLSKATQNTPHKAAFVAQPPLNTPFTSETLLLQSLIFSIFNP